MDTEKKEGFSLDDITLITKVVASERVLAKYLHNSSTFEQLKEIKKLVVTNKKPFKSKDVSDKIKQVWTFILQDSIYNLKCCDYRERARWNSIEDRHKGVRDINNEFVFGLDRLYNYFNEFTKFETVLYGVDAGYRDHVIHVFRVWMLGIVILYNSEAPEVKLDADKLIFDKIIDDHLVLNDVEIFSMWSIIALCHDLGYPLEKTEKINEAVEKMYRHLGKMNIQKFSAAFHLEHQFLNKFLLDFISSKIVRDKSSMSGDSSDDFKELSLEYPQYKKATNLDKKLKDLFLEKKVFKTNIQSKFYNKFAKSLEHYSHGIISCSILWKSLFYFLESDYNLQENSSLAFEDARQLFIRREILRAIASHTCPEIYHLNANTMSFLLILCDELQEWERPRMAEMQQGSVSSAVDKIELKKVTPEEVEFHLEYVGVSEPEEFARKIFRRWHEILRGAVDDENRKLKLSFSVKTNNKETFKFIFESNKLSTESFGGADNDNFRIYTLTGKY